MFTILLVLSLWLIFLFWFGFCLLVLGGYVLQCSLRRLPCCLYGREGFLTDCSQLVQTRSEGYKAAGQQLPALFAALH